MRPLVAAPARRALLRSTAAWLAAPALAHAARAGLVMRYFPVGPIYDFRWRLLDEVLARTRASDGPYRLEPYAEDVTQDRGLALLEQGAIDIIALGTNREREARLHPVKVDILRGMVGMRMLVIRAADQDRFARLTDAQLRSEVTFGLNSQWADVPVLRDAGYAVTTSLGYENLFDMLAAGRFDAFPRGINEAWRELARRQPSDPPLVVDETHALYFPYPIYYWVRKEATGLAARIARGLSLCLADGSFRRLFESYHAEEIARMRTFKARVIRLESSILPPGTPAVDTSWWWPQGQRKTS